VDVGEDAFAFKLAEVEDGVFFVRPKHAQC
jgi:hypothetical protein